jgi:hypothetical protein
MTAAEVKSLVFNEHFSEDRTLLQAWASHDSLERINGKDDQAPHHRARRWMWGVKDREEAGQG